MFKLQETQIPVNLSQVVKGMGYQMDPTEVNFIYDTTIMAMSDFLSQVKSKENKVALAIKDAKGNLVLAGMVAYHNNEDESMPGNWSYEFTFNEEDLQGCNVKLSTEPHFQTVFSKTLYNLFGVEMDDILALQPCIEESINVLKHWLDVNAKENDKISIEQSGYFVASVTVENGEKVFAIVPDGAMKRLIKDDSAIEA